jgi:hypothetical protein
MNRKHVIEHESKPHSPVLQGCLGTLQKVGRLRKGESGVLFSSKDRSLRLSGLGYLFGIVLHVVIGSRPIDHAKSVITISLRPRP